MKNKMLKNNINMNRISQKKIMLSRIVRILVQEKIKMIKKFRNHFQAKQKKVLIFKINGTRLFSLTW